MFIEVGNGKTMYFDNVIDFINATEDGFQSLVAKNSGRHVDAAVSKLESFDNDALEIDGLPELPDDEYKG